MNIQGTEEANTDWPTNIIVSSSVNLKPTFLIKNTTRGHKKIKRHQYDPSLHPSGNGMSSAVKTTSV
jgi:hypothetical protein